MPCPERLGQNSRSSCWRLDGRLSVALKKWLIVVGIGVFVEELVKIQKYSSMTQK